MYTRLSDTEFQRLHRAHIDSAWWKDFRRRFLEHAGYRCAVCGFAYQKTHSKWQLIADHKRYWKDGKLIFGHETFADVRCVCPTCNRKGIRTDDTVKNDRTAYWIIRTLLWATSLPFRLLRYLWRCFLHAPKSID